MPTWAAMIQKPTWATWAATARGLPASRLRVITGARMGSKLVLSFCGSVATCWAT